MQYNNLCMSRQYAFCEFRLQIVHSDVFEFQFHSSKYNTHMIIIHFVQTQGAFVGERNTTKIYMQKSDDESEIISWMSMLCTERQKESKEMPDEGR